MPTRSSSSSTSGVSVGALATDLRARLEASTSSIIYVPLDEGADVPTEAELQALMTGGLHVEHDEVRNALAVRAATDDEIAASVPPGEPAASAPAPAPTSTSSSST